MWMNGPSSSGSPEDLARLRQETQRLNANLKKATRANQQSGPTAGHYLWWWFSGAPVSGARLTDAGWFRPGREQLDPAYFGGFHYLPRLVRMLIRTGVFLALVASVYGWFFHQVLTIVIWCLVGAGAVAWVARKITLVILGHRHIKRVVRPLAAGLAPVIEMTTGRILRGLSVPRNYLNDPDAEIVIPLPDHFRAEHRTQAVRFVTGRLGGEWNSSVTRESPFYLTLTRKPTPPDYVAFADVREIIKKNGSINKILMGLGTSGEPVWLDFGSDVAHLGMSVGTGGGKTSFIQFVICQLFFHGVRDFVIIDVKLAGYRRILDMLPGLKIYQSLEDQWAAIEGVYREMLRRYEILTDDPDAKFDPLFLVLEEQNVFAGRSKRFWRRTREKDDQTTPPVWDWVAEVLFMGREVNIRIISSFQRLSADAAGGTEMRDQYGLKALSRFSPQGWDSLVGTRPRPQSVPITGRWITVMGGLHRWVQVPHGNAKEMVGFALTSVGPKAPAVSPGGVPSGVPSGETVARPEVSGTGGDAGDTPRGDTRPRLVRRELLPPAPEELSYPVAEIVPEKRFTLKQACEDGIVPLTYDAAKRRRTRAGGAFPKGIKEGNSITYTRGELEEFYEVADTREGHTIE